MIYNNPISCKTSCYKDSTSRFRYDSKSSSVTHINDKATIKNFYDGIRKTSSGNLKYNVKKLGLTDKHFDTLKNNLNQNLRLKE